MTTEDLKTDLNKCILSAKSFIIRQLPRFWWRRKIYIVKAHQTQEHFSPKSILYVLTSPELDTFSYSVTNYSEIEEAVSSLLRIEAPTSSLREEFLAIRYPKKNVLIRFAHAPHSKLAPEIGRHFATYCLSRSFKPEMIIESGIKHGLGSMVLSKSQERNRTSGYSKNYRYIGIDNYEKSGHLHLFEKHSTRLVSDTLSQLEKFSELGTKFSTLLFISDSIPGNQIQKEFESACLITESELVFAYNKNWIDNVAAPVDYVVLGETSILEKASHSFYPGRSLKILYLRRRAEFPVGLAESKSLPEIRAE